MSLTTATSPRMHFLTFLALVATAPHCSDRGRESRPTVLAQDKTDCTIAAVDLLYLRKYVLISADCEGRGRVYLVTDKAPASDVPCLPDSFNPVQMLDSMATYDLRLSPSGVDSLFTRSPYPVNYEDEGRMIVEDGKVLVDLYKSPDICVSAE